MSRLDRVTEAIRKEVSLIIHDELKDPRLGFVTVTRVEMTPDLRYAKVFFSVLGKEDDCKKTKDALDSAHGFIRKLVAERINLRLAPEIDFRQDNSTQYSVRIQEVLDEVKALPGAEKSFNEEKPRPKRKAVRREPRKSRRVHKKK